MSMFRLCLLLAVLSASVLAPDTTGHRRKKSYRYNCGVTVFYDETFVGKVNDRLSSKTNKEAEKNTKQSIKKIFGHLNGFYKKNFLDAIGGYVQLKLGSQIFLESFLVEEKTITSNMINSYMAKKVDNECLNLLLTDKPVYSSHKNVDVQGFAQSGKICSNAKLFSNPLKLVSLNGRRSLASHLFVVSSYDLSLESERHHERLALYVQHESAHTMAGIVSLLWWKKELP
ncbi:hypothetical protein Ddc_12034 [Ditylenchus destructor]|nr:hypothetical protein Ddc_12034 [Ditylenchus destructor]